MLPVFYVAGALWILPAVVTFQRGDPIGRCFGYLRHAPGAAVGRAATALGLHVAVWLVLAAPGFLPLPVDPASGAGLVLASALNALSIVVIGLLITPLMVTAYADLRARAEPPWASRELLWPRATGTACGGVGG